MSTSQNTDDKLANDGLRPSSTRYPTERQTSTYEGLSSEEEEDNELLPSKAVDEKRAARSGRMTNRRSGPSREVLYKMEEGGSRSSSAQSSQVDLHALTELRVAQRKSKVLWCGKLVLIYIAIFAAFVALLFGARWASQPSFASKLQSSNIAKTLSNGTHVFAPTTILISLDGFRADFLHRNLTPHMTKFMRDGVSPEWMLPSFPSLTFPNHYTIVTGMYPESHGIVGNSFWDPTTNKEFYYTTPSKSMTPEWWEAAQPIWETAERAGVRSAIHMWPGSEAHIGGIEPAYVDKYNSDELLDRKVDRILSWLDLPGPESMETSDKGLRPQLIAAYVPDVDSDGHAYGPNSTYIRSTILEVDGMLGLLFAGMQERNLTEIVNVVVVSDHGMATTSAERLIQYEDLLDANEIEHTDGWPLYGLRPFNTSEAKVAELHDQILAKIKHLQLDKYVDVYLRDKDMPERYHFRSNPRIAPLWIVPRTGWAIVKKAEFDLETAKVRGAIYHPLGLHGYDHENPLMRAIFLARGPAFNNPKGSEIAPFQNTEVYNIICDSLGLQPSPNNGTLRLPFTPKGLHDFNRVYEDIIEEHHYGADPAVNDKGPISATSAVSFASISTVQPVKTISDPATSFPSISTFQPIRTATDRVTQATTLPFRPEVHDGQDASDARKDRTWWQWVKDQLNKAQDWASETFGGKDKDVKAGENGAR